MRLALMTCAALVASAVVQGQTEDDLKRIQGKWKVVQAEINGENVPIDKIQYARYLFERDKLVTNEGGKRVEKNYKLNEAATPKTIDITIEYLRSAAPRDMYARATVRKLGRRVANVQVEAWQETRAKPVAGMTGHFLLRNDE